MVGEKGKSYVSDLSVPRWAGQGKARQGKEGGGQAGQKSPTLKETVPWLTPTVYLLTNTDSLAD